MFALGGKADMRRVPGRVRAPRKQVNDQTEDQRAEIAHPTQDRPILSRLPTGSDLRQGQGGTR